MSEQSNLRFLGSAAKPDAVSAMVVDDEAAVREALRQGLLLHGFDARAAGCAREALDLLAEREVAVVITDLRMPGEDGMWLLERIRSRWPDTAVIVLTAYAEVDTAVACLRRGASDFLTKPVQMAHVLTTMDRALDRRRLLIQNRAYQQRLEERVREATSDLREALSEIERTYHMTLAALSSAVDARERETGNHSQRVMVYTVLLAERLGVDAEAREHFARGALLHDIGKIGVPDEILLKPGELSREEWRQMRRHPKIGYQILREIPFLVPAAEIVLAHHEWYDGSGYPAGLAGEQIPVGARVFAVADALDAITSDRPYRPSAHLEDALEEIRSCSGRQFDPEVVDVLVDVGPQALRAAIARQGSELDGVP
mgnify:FL=1